MSNTSSSYSKRKSLLLSSTVIFILIALVYLVWKLFFAGHTENTEDAYVHGNMVQVTAQQNGTIVAIHADDTQIVKAHQDLLSLDQADSRIALQQAQAKLAQSVRKTRTLYAQNSALEAEVKVREAEAEQARVKQERARHDLHRRQQLSKIGGISGEELTHAQTALQAAQSALHQAQAATAAAQARLNTNLALTAGTRVEEHPDVQLAAEQYRQAWVEQARTKIIAPVSGLVAQRMAQVGQHISAGTPLMAIVPLDQLWVEANFKENQLADMKPGQKVSLHADYYGKSVRYQGVIDGISAGTGGAFSLLPAQNASGNWIKVVQRVPVRIRLNPDEVLAHPLRIGLSMNVTVDLDSEPSDEPSPMAELNTSIYELDQAQAQEQIEHIINTNLAS